MTIIVIKEKKDSQFFCIKLSSFPTVKFAREDEYWINMFVTNTDLPCRVRI